MSFIAFGTLRAAVELAVAPGAYVHRRAAQIAGNAFGEHGFGCLLGLAAQLAHRFCVVALGVAGAAEERAEPADLHSHWSAALVANDLRYVAFLLGIFHREFEGDVEIIHHL